MKTKLIKAIGVAGIAAVAMATASSASAARVLCNTGPGIDLVSDPCVWSPGPPGNDNEAAVEQAILAATGSSVDLMLFGKSDDNPGLFSFSAGPEGVFSTDWTILSGMNVNYVTVKGANEFKVYELAGMGANSGTVSTDGLLTPNGRNQPGISHISFWTATAAVPEPDVWAMMLIGFFGIGGVLRRKGHTRRVSTRLA